MTGAASAAGKIREIEKAHRTIICQPHQPINLILNSQSLSTALGIQTAGARNASSPTHNSSRNRKRAALRIPSARRPCLPPQTPVYTFPVTLHSVNHENPPFVT